MLRRIKEKISELVQLVHDKANEINHMVTTSFLLGLSANFGLSVKSVLNRSRLPEPFRHAVATGVAVYTAGALIVIYRRSHLAEEVPGLKKENAQNTQQLLACEAQIQAAENASRQQTKTLDQVNKQVQQYQQKKIVDSRGVTRCELSTVVQTLFARPRPEVRAPLTVPGAVLN